MNTKTLGDAGEALAAQYLLKQGCIILARQYKTVCGEVDLIVRDRNTVAFVEVKTRRSNRFGTPGQAVDRRKQYKIIRTAQCYLMRGKIGNCSCRFDVVEIYYKNDAEYAINWLKHAFELA